MTTRPVHPFMAALAALAERVRVAHGAMSPMLQARNPSQGNFAGLEGCTEIRYVTRPDIVRAVHRAYLDGRGGRHRDQAPRGEILTRPVSAL